jgi:hypothetical protein
MMQYNFKKLIPKKLILFFNQKKKELNLKKHDHVPLDEKFREYYQTNFWGGDESLSGRGSDSVQTATLLYELNKLVQTYNFSSILDIPCGDFNWMKNFDYNEIKYIGADIVSDLIIKNQCTYNINPNITFEVLDLTTGPLPKVDIILCRDCLVHFSYKNIFLAISNIKRSNSEYLLVTSFLNRKKNYNIANGDWRPLNLEEKPFFFPKPQYVIMENCSEDGGKYVDKSLCLWKIKDLPIFPVK